MFDVAKQTFRFIREEPERPSPYEGRRNAMRSYHLRIVLISAILAAGWVFFSLSVGAGNFSHAAAESPETNDAHAGTVPVNGAPLPDTGQTQDYTSIFGEDSDYLINPPSYTKLDENGNDLPDSATEWIMVRDNVTGLIWEKKTDDGSIHDRDNQFDWYDALGVFISEVNGTSFGGHSDWRIPSIKELASITDLGKYNPATNTNFFCNTLSSDYWSSTTAAYNTDFAWYVDLDRGHVNYYDKSKSNYARAVCGGQTGLLDHLVNNGDNTVTDTVTGLMWQQATDEKMEWETAISHCEGLALAGYDDWRLPNQRELRSIADYSKTHPAINTTYFPDTLSSYYWSSTTYDIFTGYEWYVYFYYGDSGYYTKSYSYYVRAVRGGQSRLLDHLVIWSPAQGSTWELGDSMPIRWDTQGIPGEVEISISWQGGKTGTFEPIAAPTENDGSYDWTVDGECSVNCVLRIVLLDDVESETTQGLFSIKTRAVPPTITTEAISSITTNSASSGGDITFDGGASITARGVCWSTSENPTIADSHTSDGTGTGSFTSFITGLSPGTTYHVRAYATNSAGTGYGDDFSFTSAASNTLYVKADGYCNVYLPCYTTIQAAISAANDGDTILVCHGDYSETIVLNEGKKLRLLCGWDDAFETNSLFSTVSAMRIEKGTLIVEGLSLSGE